MSAAQSADPILARISELLALRERESTIEAISLASALPSPGEAPDDLVAQAWFDLGFGMEHYGEYESSADLYRRSLEYRVVNTNIAAASWFRLAWCSEQLKDWKVAVRGYEKAIEFGRDWPYMF